LIFSDSKDKKNGKFWKLLLFPLDENLQHQLEDNNGDLEIEEKFMGLHSILDIQVTSEVRSKQLKKPPGAEFVYPFVPDETTKLKTKLLEIYSKYLNHKTIDIPYLNQEIRFMESLMVSQETGNPLEFQP
jgi:hypothetical protein